MFSYLRILIVILYNIELLEYSLFHLLNSLGIVFLRRDSFHLYIFICIFFVYSYFFLYTAICIFLFCLALSGTQEQK